MAREPAGPFRSPSHVPRRRQIDPAAPLNPKVPVAVDHGVLAVGALVVAVLVAVAAALVPSASLWLVPTALAIAIPACAVALRDHARRRTAEPGAARARRRGRASTDALTGAADAPGLATAIQVAMDEKLDTAPVTMVRLAIRAPALAESTEDLRRLLVVAAVRWQEILRPGDTLARTGPTDFAVLLPRCEPRAVAAVVSRLRAAVPEAAQSTVGVATWDGAETAEQFLGRADTALETELTRVERDPLADPHRLAAVQATGLAIRESQDEFDSIAASVAWLLSTPIVLITLFDETWQHFIGEHGVADAGGPREGIPAKDALCHQTVTTGQPLVVSDTERHAALREISTARDFGIAACASVPIVNAAGHVLGSVCAMMRERHRWSADDVALLRLTAHRISGRLAELPAAAQPVLDASRAS